MSGIFRIITVADLKFSIWGWKPFDGITTALLRDRSLAAVAHLGLWFIGLAVGIEMIIRGWSGVALAIGAHGLSAELARGLP